MAKLCAIGHRAKQRDVTHAHHRRGFGVKPPAAGQLRSFSLLFENQSYQVSYFLEPFEGIKLQKRKGQLKN